MTLGWNWKFRLTKQSDKISTWIQKMVKENRVFYSDNETGEVFRNYLSGASAKGEFTRGLYERGVE